MTYLPIADSQPYMNALGALATRNGAWLAVGGGLSRIEFEFDFALGAGTVTGAISVEHTAQLNGAMPTNGTRIVLPVGSLHTTLTTAALNTAGTQVTLTALTTGRLAVMLGSVPPGNIRCIYTFTSGAGAAPNTVTCWATAS
jgi:hypothetical protein